MSRAKPSGIRLSDSDAAVVKGMLERGDRQHDIAAWFGVNGGRIGDIQTGKQFADVHAIHDNLPPPGPYLSGRVAEDLHQTIQGLIASMRATADQLEQRLDSI